jgi:putative transposase
VKHVKNRMEISERRACKVVGQPRSTQRRRHKIADEEARLVERMIKLATRYGRYGYRRITVLLQWEGWRVSRHRVERLWKREGLKVPKKQPKRGRLWLNDGSCVRRRPEHKDHIWSYDFVQTRTSNGRSIPVGNQNPALPIAARTRLRDSLTAPSGRPTIWKTI